MKMLLSVIFTLFLLLSPVRVYAEDNVLSYDTDSLMNSLPDSAKSSLSDLGITSPDIKDSVI